jgi:hypothetical protein
VFPLAPGKEGLGWEGLREREAKRRRTPAAPGKASIQRAARAKMVRVATASALALVAIAVREAERTPKMREAAAVERPAEAPREISRGCFSALLR